MTYAVKDDTETKLQFKS